jgi:hypothetical protein
MKFELVINQNLEILPIGSHPKGKREKVPTLIPLANAVKAQIHAMEEKGSDVVARKIIWQ